MKPTVIYEKDSFRLVADNPGIEAASIRFYAEVRFCDALGCNCWQPAGQPNTIIADALRHYVHTYMELMGSRVP